MPLSFGHEVDTPQPDLAGRRIEEPDAQVLRVGSEGRPEVCDVIRGDHRANPRGMSTQPVYFYTNELRRGKYLPYG